MVYLQICWTIDAYIGPRKSGPRCSIISSKMKSKNLVYGLEAPSAPYGVNLLVRRSWTTPWTRVLCVLKRAPMHSPRSSWSWNSFLFSSFNTSKSSSSRPSSSSSTLLFSCSYFLLSLILFSDDSMKDQTLAWNWLTESATRRFCPASSMISLSAWA